MSRMWTRIPDKGLVEVSPPDLETLIEWIVALAGGGRNTIHMELSMGEISISRFGGGDSAQMKLRFNKKEIGVGLKMDPTNIEADGHDITDYDALPIYYILTLTREQACQIMTHLVEQGKFPKEVRADMASWASAEKRIVERIKEREKQSEKQGKHPGWLPLERDWDMDVEVWKLLRGSMKDQLREWLRQDEASDAPPLFLETMHRLYGKYFGEGAAPAYETYWTFIRPRGDGNIAAGCFLACMIELAKKNGDDQHLAFIEKEYDRVMSQPFSY